MAANGIPAKPPSSGAGKQSLPPNQTLYVTNLPTKIHKPDLRRALYTLFSTHGPVIDIVAMKTMKMRGQAHIVFRDINTSSQAMRALQGFEFFGQELKISYAKGKSDIISRLDGSAKLPEGAKPAPAQTEAQKAVFGAPPGGPPTSSAALSKPLAAPVEHLKAPAAASEDGSKSPQGVKRPREEESDDEGAPMEEDDDDGDAMEESDDDD